MEKDSGLEQFVQTFFSDILSDDAFSYVIVNCYLLFQPGMPEGMSGKPELSDQP